MQLKEEPVLPTKINPGISVEIEKIISKALEKDPVHRYRTITEL
jgi:eukaryotic-like serine/threonine-protein kinase